MTLVLVTGPTVEPLTAAEVRTRLGLDDTVTDTVLDPLIKGAREDIDGKDGWLGRALITQAWDLFLNRFPCEIELPLPPTQSVLSVKYIDGDGILQTWDAANYTVVPDGFIWRVVPAVGVSWPSSRWQANAIVVRFIAGYGDAGSDVPELIREAIAEKVSLRRLMARPDPSVRSETTDGIDSVTYSTGQDFADTLRSSIDEKLTRYRIW